MLGTMRSTGMERTPVSAVAGVDSEGGLASGPDPGPEVGLGSIDENAFSLLICVPTRTGVGMAMRLDSPRPRRLVLEPG